MVDNLKKKILLKMKDMEKIWLNYQKKQKKNLKNIILILKKVIKLQIQKKEVFQIID